MRPALTVAASAGVPQRLQPVGVVVLAEQVEELRVQLLIHRLVAHDGHGVLRRAGQRPQVCTLPRSPPLLAPCAWMEQHFSRLPAASPALLAAELRTGNSLPRASCCCKNFFIAARMQKLAWRTVNLSTFAVEGALVLASAEQLLQEGGVVDCTCQEGHHLLLAHLRRLHAARHAPHLVLMCLRTHLLLRRTS